MKLGRRELFRLGGLSGLAGALGAGLGFAAKSAGSPLVPESVDCGPAAEKGGAYGKMAAPPAYLGANALDAAHSPPPFSTAQTPQNIELNIISSTREVGAGANVELWTYNGTAPGPTLRAEAGERLNVTLINNTKRRHSLHFHGSHDVTQDGWQSVQPGTRQTYEIEAGPIGLHPYHCHTSPYAWHMAKGMYGVMIVDPPGGRPPAHEFVLSLSGFDINGDGKNEVYAWNGIAGFYDRFPLKVPVGELVRVYLTNFVEYDPIGSFHLHGQTFDVYRSGTSLKPQDHTDVITLGQTERAILEFRLPRRGRYMFHPHQIHMAEKGAMGWFAAV
jgi:FtsP/CotA-like multicopper oxidase with cupredoxin domain